MRYVLVYDVADDKRRNKIAKLLLDYGDRVQYSVFEANLEAPDVAKIVKRVEVILGEADGDLRIYSLCKACAERVVVVGRDTTPVTPEGWLVLE